MSDIRKLNFDLDARRTRFSEQDVFAELRRFAESVAPPLNAAKYKKWDSRISIDTINRMFGGFAKACERAGLEGIAASRYHSDDDLLSYFESLMRWRHEKGFQSHVPVSLDFERYNHQNGTSIHYSTFTKRFGPYRRFLELYSDYHNAKITRDALLKLAKKPAKNKRGPISARDRAEVLRRDGSRCRSCGRSVDDLKSNEYLEVDHIIPVAKGGTSELSNLGINCTLCNNGKGARFTG